MVVRFFQTGDAGRVSTGAEEKMTLGRELTAVKESPTEKRLYRR